HLVAITRGRDAVRMRSQLSQSPPDKINETSPDRRSYQREFDLVRFQIRSRFQYLCGDGRHNWRCEACTVDVLVVTAYDIVIPDLQPHDLPQQVRRKFCRVIQIFVDSRMTSDDLPQF